MKKIPSLFERDWLGDKSRVLDKVNPACCWVIDGEGVATRKYDGTAVMIRNSILYCRYDAKSGKTPPEGFLPAQDDPDPETGHWPGWLPAGESPMYKWQSAYLVSHHLEDGTYEACGPHFQANPESFSEDVFIPHGKDILPDAPRTFQGLAEWFKGKDIEGIVWHHPDGRMAKIKKKDFGLKRRDSAADIAD